VQYKRFVGYCNGLARELSSPCFVGHPLLNQTPGTPLDPNLQGARQYLATWDTGSTATVISQKVIDELGVQPIGFTKVQTVGGEVQDAPVFLVSVWLTNQVCVCYTKAIRGEVFGNSEMLIGMDIIGSGDFAVLNKNGKTMFVFQSPPGGKMEAYDTLARDERRIETTSRPTTILQRPARNAPCPCGSGKKYKLCCLKKAI